jgi:hypothetical protein
MKTKTAYRLPKNIPVETPDIPEEPIQPSETVDINFDTTDKAEPNEAVAEALQKAAEADEASEALKRQLAHLQASEQAQREFAAQVAAQRAAQAAPAPTLPAEPEARIALWRQHGLSADDASFLAAHHELVAEPHLCRLASDEAALHHERDTDAHRAATLEAFHRLQGQASPATQPTPEFFAPPRAAPSPATERPSPAAFVSAPVSRGTPSGETGYRPARKITLTPQDQEYARIAGISDTEYARQKQKLALHKANGDYTGRE